MEKKYNCDSSKPDRKSVERIRRMQMNDLCFKLSSLIPEHYRSSKDAWPQRDKLGQAAIYIKELRERIEELKRKKQLMMGIEGTTNSVMPGLIMPILELRDMGSTLEVILISGLNKNFMLYKVISVLEEEGAEVMSLHLSVLGDKVKSSRVGVETSRVLERLKELIY